MKTNETQPESMNATSLEAARRENLSLKQILNPLDIRFDPLRYSKGKSHFQLAFIFVPSKSRRKLLDSFYAFCRIADDLSDEPGLSSDERRAALETLRNWLKSAARVAHPFWDEFQLTLTQYKIPKKHLAGVLAGVERDISPNSSVEYATWAELEAYVEGVAVDVGATVLHILGAQDSRLENYARHLGRCVQYLNFARDLEDDLKMNRHYLPKESQASQKDPRQIFFERALKEWQQSAPYDWRCLPAELMVRIYLEAFRQVWVLKPDERISTIRKSLWALKHCLYFALEQWGVKRPWLK